MASRAAVDGRRPVVRLVTTRGVLRVRPCGRCAALVLAEGEGQHERAHQADARRADR